MNRYRIEAYGLAAGVAMGLGLAGLATLLSRGAWGYPLLPRVASLYLGLPFGIAALALLLASAVARSPSTRRLAFAAAWPAAFAVGTLLCVPLNWIVARHDLGEARSFCQYLAPEIDRYRVEQGRHPDDIAWLLRKQPDLPKLVEKCLQYHVDGASYRFDIVDPSRPFAWHSYDRATDRWTVVED